MKNFLTSSIPVLGKVFKDKNKLSLLLAFLLATISFLAVLDRDVDGEVWDMGNALLYGQQAKVEGKPLLDFLTAEIPDGNEATNVYEKNLLFIPLWQSLVYAGLKVFGSINFSVIFWSAVIGFSSVLAIFFIGKKIYSSFVGLAAAAVLATTPFYLTHAKSGFGYYSLVVLLVELLFYFFYSAHFPKKNRANLFLAAFFLFLILFNGLPIFNICLQVILVFLLLNFRYKNFLKSLKQPRTFLVKAIDGGGKSLLFGVKDYFLFFGISFFLFFSAGSVFALFFNSSPRILFEKIYIFWYSSRATWFLKGFFLDPEKTLPNLLVMGKSLFLKVPFKETDGYLTILSSPGYPMFTIVIWGLVLLALVYGIKKKDRFIIFCLIWLVVQVFATTIFAGFTLRNWLFSLPCIALLSAVGLRDVMTVPDKKSIKKFSGKKVKLVVFFLFSLTILAGYCYYFFYFFKHDSFLARASQQEEVYRFIRSLGDSDEILVILDSFNPTPKDALLFFNPDQAYDSIYYWPEIINKVSGGNVLGLKSFQEGQLIIWEKNQLLDKKKLVYVFSEANYSHFPKGIKLWGKSDFSLFESIHADLKPAKVIYYQENIPATSIYIVERENSPVFESKFNVGKSREFPFWSFSDGEIKSIKLSGPVTSGKLCLNSQPCLDMLPFLRHGETLELARDWSSIRFSPLLTTNKDPILWEGDGVDILTEEGGIEGFFINFLHSGSKVTFKVRNLALINNVFIQSFPRIRHDFEGKNRLRLDFSEDGRHYKKIYEVKSNGGNYWEWPYLLTSTHAVKVKSKEIYFRFTFNGHPGGGQLWSSIANETYFLALGEGWLNKNTFNQGKNYLRFDGGEGDGGLSVFSPLKLFPIFAEGGEGIRVNDTPYRTWQFGEDGKLLVEDWPVGRERSLLWGSQIQDKDLLITPLGRIYSALTFLGQGGFVAANVFDDSFSENTVHFLGRAVSQNGYIRKENLKLEPGDYLLRSLASSGSEQKGKEIATVTVRSQNKESLLNETLFGGADSAFSEFIYPFKISSGQDSVTLSFEPNKETQVFLNAFEIFKIVKTIEGELLSRGSGSEIVNDDQASGGKAVLEKIDASPVGGHIFRGSPEINLSRGDYNSFYRMKVSNNEKKKGVVSIDVVSSGLVYDSREIKMSDFNHPGDYQYFSLSMSDFIFGSSTEFRGVWYPKTTQLWLDKIEIGESYFSFPLGETSILQTSIPGSENETVLLFRRSGFLNDPVLEGIVPAEGEDGVLLIMRLKVGQTQKGKIGSLKIWQNSGSDVVYKRDIFALPSTNFQTISLPIKLPNLKNLNFAFFGAAGADFYLDYLDFIAL